MSPGAALLADVCDISMGQAPSGDTYNTEGKGLPLIAGAGDFGDLTPKPTKFTTSPTKISRSGDLILCIRATIGDRNWSDGEYCLGRGVAGLSARPHKLDQKYLWHWLGYATPKLKAKGRGATFLQVNKADIGSMEVPLPPLDEQRRIAAILDKADALRAKRREAIAKLDQLLQSVFLDMFGDPAINPKDWPTRSLKELGKVQTGSTPPSSADGMFDGSVPFVTPGDLGGVLVTSKRTLTSAGAARSRIATPGSTLVCCIGATIGKMGMATQDSAFNQQINAVSWGDKVVPLYGFRLMRFFAKEIATRGASTTLPILKKSAFERIEVPIASFELQQHFALVAERIARQEQALLQSAKQQNALFTSLQHRAFSGTL